MPAITQQHKIAEYKAREGFVLCTCGFTTYDTEEYDQHTLSFAKNRKRKGTLRMLEDTKYARNEYYNQSYGSPYGRSDKEFV